MVKTSSSDRNLLNRAFPFMTNFPFDGDFEITMVDRPAVSFILEDEFDAISKKPAKIINFKYKHSPFKATITMTPSELAWLDQRAEPIKKFDKIVKTINRGLRSKDIISKRDASNAADEWLTQLADNNSQLSKETFYEVLKSLLDDRTVNQTAKFINDLTRLISKKGLVRMSNSDLNTAFTYFQFKLIYSKLMIGIVIASKISI